MQSVIVILAALAISAQAWSFNLGPDGAATITGKPKPPQTTGAQGPTQGPTGQPSQGPTGGPTQGPTQGPTGQHSQGPTGGPTQGPTEGPSHAPTQGAQTTGPVQPSTRGPAPPASTAAPQQPTTPGHTDAPVTPTGEPPHQFGSFFNIGNGSYFYSCNKGDDFFSAHFYCNSFHGNNYDVVSITNENVNGILQAIGSFGQGAPCNCLPARIYIGLVYEEETDRYVWIHDGSALEGYSNFESSGPHAAGHNCVLLNIQTGKWEKDLCDLKDKGFMCEAF